MVKKWYGHGRSGRTSCAGPVYVYPDSWQHQKSFGIWRICVPVSEMETILEHNSLTIVNKFIAVLSKEVSMTQVSLQFFLRLSSIPKKSPRFTCVL